MIPALEDWIHALKDRYGSELHEKLDSTTVAVCGLGGLGSNIAIALARAGVGHLILIDFDTVDVTNLHRQQYKASQIGQLKVDALADNLQEIHPYVRLTKSCGRIDDDSLEDALWGADIVCEAFDSPEAKAMLVNGVLERLPHVFLVAASGMAGMDSPNAIRTRRITARFYLCGDEVSDVAISKGLVASRVMLCAAHQAHTVIRIIAGHYDV